MKKIAVLLTCHNRKEKTLVCLKHLFDSMRVSNSLIEMEIYVTDDGSVDGTSEAISKQFPDIQLLSGDGSLFWSGGMRNSWSEAIKQRYDGYLLLNDDTLMDSSCMMELFGIHEYSLGKFGKGGIYIGSVVDPRTGEFTYGGRRLINKWTFKTKAVIPDGAISSCELGNANIMFVHSDVSDSLGILNKRYIHGKADYDYTLQAIKRGFPVLVCAEYCGTCTFDFREPDLRTMAFRERLQYLKSPKGVELKGYMYFMWKYFPTRAPFVFISLWLKTLFPHFEGIINRMFGRK